MLRLVVVVVGASGMALCALQGGIWRSVGSVVGILLGVVYFALALSRNDGLINASLRPDPARPHDPNAAISMGLGAAGLALSAVGNLHYPVGFRLFYWFCLVLGLFIACFQAIKNRVLIPAKAPVNSSGAAESDSAKAPPAD